MDQWTSSTQKINLSTIEPIYLLKRPIMKDLHTNLIYRLRPSILKMYSITHTSCKASSGLRESIPLFGSKSTWLTPCLKCTPKFEKPLFLLVFLDQVHPINVLSGRRGKLLPFNGAAVADY